MASVETLAFKWNNGFSRPSYLICTPDSKMMLLIMCCSPQHWPGCLWGHRRVEGPFQMGVKTDFLGGKRNKVKLEFSGAGHGRQADTSGSFSPSKAEHDSTS